LAYEKVLDGFDFKPKVNTKFNERREYCDFISRQTNHIKKVENKTKSVMKQTENYSYKPKLNLKSLHMVKNREISSKHDDDFGFPQGPNKSFTGTSYCKP